MRLTTEISWNKKKISSLLDRFIPKITFFPNNFFIIVSHSQKLIKSQKLLTMLSSISLIQLKDYRKSSSISNILSFLFRYLSIILTSMPDLSRRWLLWWSPRSSNQWAWLQRAKKNGKEPCKLSLRTHQKW